MKPFIFLEPILLERMRFLSQDPYSPVREHFYFPVKTNITKDCNTLRAIIFHLVNYK